jgi:hypothetical protein
VRLIDPVSAGIGAVEDDLLDATLALPVLRPERDLLLEIFEQDLQDAFQLALLGRRKMTEIGSDRAILRGRDAAGEYGESAPKASVPTS